MVCKNTISYTFVLTVNSNLKFRYTRIKIIAGNFVVVTNNKKKKKGKEKKKEPKQKPDSQLQLEGNQRLNKIRKLNMKKIKKQKARESE